MITLGGLEIRMEDKMGFRDTSNALFLDLLVVSIALYFWIFNEVDMYNIHFSVFILYVLKSSFKIIH